MYYTCRKLYIALMTACAYYGKCCTRRDNIIKLIIRASVRLTDMCVYEGFYNQTIGIVTFVLLHELYSVVRFLG